MLGRRQRKLTGRLVTSSMFSSWLLDSVCLLSRVFCPVLDTADLPYAVISACYYFLPFKELTILITVQQVV